MQELKDQTEPNLPLQKIAPTEVTSRHEIPNLSFPTSNKHKYWVILMALFGITLLGIISTFFYYTGRTIDQAVLSEPSLTEISKPSVSPVAESISSPRVEYPEYVYEPAIELLANGETHFDPQDNISFKYPNNLFPLELGQGVVTFFKSENDMLACKNKTEEYACYRKYFSYNGSRRGTTAEIPEDILEPHTVTDDKGRIWTVEVLMAAATNYTAYTTIDGENVLFAMQGNPRGDIDDFSNFADQILSTFELTD